MMSRFAGQFDFEAPAAQFHLLGTVDFSSIEALQQRLVFEAGERGGRGMTVLMCEHPELLTIGRNGSRAHIRLEQRELARRRLGIRWIGRGGGCVLHAPGQLAVYPIVPLEQFDWTVGEYARRLQHGIAEALAKLGVHGETRSGRLGIWGRTGQLVAFGLAVRDWVAYHGAFINVSPAMNGFGYVDSALTRARGGRNGEKSTMGCLLAETGRAATMSKVRAQIVPHLAQAFACDRYHLHTGHPLLKKGVAPLFCGPRRGAG